MSLLLKVPEEVHDEIFLKLPAKSILSYRCVCKHFYNLLSKPSFIKNHVNRTKNSNPRLMFINSSRHAPPMSNNSSGDKPPMIYTIPIDHSSISSSLSLREIDGSSLINYPFESQNYYSLEFVGSCNGLVCLKISIRDKADLYNVKTRFSVWNPLSREFKETSQPQYDYGVICGFGYDSNIDDYKLVLISDFYGYGKRSCFKIDVYTVRSDSWRNIQGTGNYSIPRGTSSHGVFFNGALHWLGSTTTQNTTSDIIISFHISNETMMDMPLPENVMQSVDFPGEMHMSVRLWGDCLCMAFIRKFYTVEVWVMQEYGVKESWIRKYTTTTQIPGRGIPWWKPLWSYENEEILVEYCLENLLLCDQTNEKVRPVVVGDVTHLHHRETYVESIVSLGSGTYLEKRITDGILKNPSDNS